MRDGETVLGYLISTDAIPEGSIVDVVLLANGTMRARAHQAPMLDLASMTWTCMVCGDERPDAAISVAHRQIPGLEDMFPEGARTNVRYCNDRPACTTVATASGVWPPQSVRVAQPLGVQAEDLPPVEASVGAAAGQVCDLAAGVHVDPHKGCIFH